MLRYLVAFSLLGATASFAHARLSTPGTTPPRSTDDGLKSGPCGDIAKATDPINRTVLVAGTQVTMVWEETINHPGRYEFSFSESGDFDADTIILDEVLDVQNGPVVRMNPATWHRYSHELTVPSTLCEECSIRMIQWMEENPAMPRPYYSCADVRIVAAGDPVAKPAPPSGFTAVLEGDL